MDPFLDVTALSDEVLNKRIDRSYLYMSQQTALGRTPTVNSIKIVLESLLEERQRRSRLFREEGSVKPPDVINIGVIDFD